MVSPNYERRGIINRVGGTPNLGVVQSTYNPKMLTFYVWFCFLCKFVAYYTMYSRLLFVISVYFTLYMLLLLVFSHIKALCGLQSNSPKGHGRLE